MPHLSKKHINSYVGDVLPLSLVIEDRVADAKVTWRVEGDATIIRTFVSETAFSFDDGVLVALVAVGSATIIAEYLGEEYRVEVEAREMRSANATSSLNYYIGDLHDHTSMNHNPAQFATHIDGDITDYTNYIREENLIDFGVISDHAGVTNDVDFFRGFKIADEDIEGPIIFAGAESEIMFAERDRLDVLHRNSGEIVTFMSTGYGEVRSWEEFYAFMAPSPAPIGIFAHPHVVGFSTNGIWNFSFNRHNTPLMLSVMRGVEMGNGADRKENLLHEYALSAALDAGFRVSTTCSSDSHGAKWGYYIMPGKTVIMAPEKSKEAFHDALLHNRFYATESGNVKLSYSVNGKTAPADLPAATEYHFSVNMSYFFEDDTTRPRICQVISDYGRVVKEVMVDSDSFEFSVLSDTARYFYMRLVDEKGRKTWSPPVFTGRAYDTYRERNYIPMDMSSFVATSSGVEIPDVIDGDPFHTWYSGEAKPSVLIDMGEEKEVAAIGYYPHIVLRDKTKGSAWTTSMETAGLVSRYRVLTSTDGHDFTIAAEGVCQNLGAELIIDLDKTRARYVRFDVLGNVGLDSMMEAYKDSTARIANLALFQ